MIALAVWLVGAWAAPQQEKSAPEAPSAFVEPQDPDRPALPASDLKALRETNIYSPRRVVRKPPDLRGSKSSSGAADGPRVPKPPLVTGIIFDPVSKQYQVVIEDRNPEKLRLLAEPKFLKAGDQVLIYTIEKVESEKVTVSAAGTTKEFKVGDALPEAGLKAPESSEVFPDEDGDAPPADAKVDPKVEPKAEGKRPDASGTSSTMDEETRKKVLEERMKRLGKKRSE